MDPYILEQKIEETLIEDEQANYDYDDSAIILEETNALPLEIQEKVRQGEYL